MVLDPGVFQPRGIDDGRDACGDRQPSGIGVHVEAERGGTTHKYLPW
jgi:hypothetical protein